MYSVQHRDLSLIFRKRLTYTHHLGRSSQTQLYLSAFAWLLVTLRILAVLSALLLSALVHMKLVFSSIITFMTVPPPYVATGCVTELSEQRCVPN